MKIAFVVGEFPAISETFILNQITGLLDLGHDVHIFANVDPKESIVHADLQKYNLKNRVVYFNIPSNRLLRVFKAMLLLFLNFHRNPRMIIQSLNVIRFKKYALSLELFYMVIPFLGKSFDIIQCHFGPYGNFMAYLNEVGVKGKLVTMFHGYDVKRGIENGASVYVQLLKRGHCFLANSLYTYQQLIRLGFSPNKTRVHTVGIQVNKFPFRCRSNPTEPTNNIIILTIARLSEEKGLIYGIQAVKRVVENNPSISLEYQIIGGGGLEQQLKKLCDNLSISHVVKFLGPMEQERLIGYLLAAHIFLIPSLSEGLGMALLEAQAVGLPIVATTVGGIPEAVRDGKSGFLVPERDSSALAEKIEYLIYHREEWAKMSQFGRSHVEENFDVRKLNRKLVEIYETLLAYPNDQREK